MLDNRHYLRFIEGPAGSPGGSTTPDEPTDTTGTDDAPGQGNQPSDPDTPKGIKERLQDAEKDAERWKTFSRQWESRAKAAHKELETLKAAADTNKPDPAETEQLNERISKLSEENTAMRREMACWRVLTRMGMNAYRVMDSRAFNNTIADLDPDADDFDQQVKTAAKEVPTLAGFSDETSANDGGEGTRLWRALHPKK